MSFQHVVITGLVPKIILSFITVIVSLACRTLVVIRIYLAKGWCVTKHLFLESILRRCEVYSCIQIMFTHLRWRLAMTLSECMLYRRWHGTHRSSRYISNECFKFLDPSILLCDFFLCLFQFHFSL